MGAPILQPFNAAKRSKDAGMRDRKGGSILKHCRCTGMDIAMLLTASLLIPPANPLALRLHKH